MISSRVKRGLVGMSVSVTGDVLLQVTENGDGWCEQARAVLTPDEAEEMANRLLEKAAEARQGGRDAEAGD